MKALAEALSPKGGEIIPTIADSWIEKGLQQGILQKAREDVIDILELRFEGVPQSIVKTLYEM